MPINEPCFRVGPSQSGNPMILGTLWVTRHFGTHWNGYAISDSYADMSRLNRVHSLMCCVAAAHIGGPSPQSEVNSFLYNNDEMCRNALGEMFPVTQTSENSIGQACRMVRMLRWGLNQTTEPLRLRDSTSGHTFYAHSVMSAEEARAGASRHLDALMPIIEHDVVMFVDRNGDQHYIDDRGWYFQTHDGHVVEANHIARMPNETPFLRVVRDMERAVAHAMREYADEHEGREWFTSRRLDTPLVRRLGISRDTFSTWFRGTMTQAINRLNVPPIPRAVREAEGSSRRWNWNRIPPRVAEVMMQDLAMHLEEPS